MLGSAGSLSVQGKLVETQRAASLDHVITAFNNDSPIIDSMVSKVDKSHDMHKC